MNRESNKYTIIYAVIMVIIVALGLSFTHQMLLERQVANENIDKMQQILLSLNIVVDVEDAEVTYDKLITDAYLITNKGIKIEGTEGTTAEDPAFYPEE